MLFQRCLRQDEYHIGRWSNVFIRDQKSVDRQEVVHVTLLIAGCTDASGKETVLLNRADVAILSHVNQRVRHIGELALRDLKAG